MRRDKDAENRLMESVAEKMGTPVTVTEALDKGRVAAALAQLENAMDNMEKAVKGTILDRVLKPVEKSWDRFFDIASDEIEA